MFCISTTRNNTGIRPTLQYNSCEVFAEEGHFIAFLWAFRQVAMLCYASAGLYESNVSLCPSVTRRN